MAHNGQAPAYVTNLIHSHSATRSLQPAGKAL